MLTLTALIALPFLIYFFPENFTWGGVRDTILSMKNNPEEWSLSRNEHHKSAYHAPTKTEIDFFCGVKIVEPFYNKCSPWQSLLLFIARRKLASLKTSQKLKEKPNG